MYHSANIEHIYQVIMQVSDWLNLAPEGRIPEECTELYDSGPNEDE